MGFPFSLPQPNHHGHCALCQAGYPTLSLTTWTTLVLDDWIVALAMKKECQHRRKLCRVRRHVFSVILLRTMLLPYNWTTVRSA